MVSEAGGIEEDSRNNDSRDDYTAGISANTEASSALLPEDDSDIEWSHDPARRPHIAAGCAAKTAATAETKDRD